MLKNYLPDLVPPSKNIKQYLPLSADTPSPLKIANGLKMDMYFDLRSDLPNMLSFDEKGVLFATISNLGKIIAFSGSAKVDVIKGISNPKGLTFNGSNLFVIENYTIVKYLYDSETFNLTGKEIVVDFSKEKKYSPQDIRVVDNKVYLTDGARVMSVSLDGTNLVSEDPSKNSVFLERDSAGNLYKVDNNRVTKFDTFAGEINGREDVVSGFTQDSGEILGKVKDLVVDKAGNIYVSDNQTGMIYIISK